MDFFPHKFSSFLGAAVSWYMYILKVWASIDHHEWQLSMEKIRITQEARVLAYAEPLCCFLLSNLMPGFCIVTSRPTSGRLMED